MSTKKAVNSSYQPINEHDEDNEHEDVALKSAVDISNKAMRGIDALYGSTKKLQPANIATTKLGHSGDAEMELKHQESNEWNKSAEIQIEAVKNECDPKTEVIDLPHDVLVAYMLIHLENDGERAVWDQYSFLGKLGIIMAVATPLAIQFFVAGTLCSTLSFDQVDRITDVDAKGIWYNIVSLAVLFVYMFRDLGGYILVWRASGRIEQQQKVEYNPFHKSRLAEFGHNIVDVSRWDYHNLDPRQIDYRKHKQSLLFIQFRVLILGVFALYMMLTFYSLVQIATNEELDEKLEVSIAIFFLLEVDDWCYELFFAQNGLLQDSQFELEFKLPNINLSIEQMGNAQNRCFVLNTLLTNRVGNIRKEIYNRYKDELSEFVNKSCIILKWKGKVMTMERTVEDYGMKEADTITWSVEHNNKSQSAEDTERVDKSEDEHEKNEIFDQRTKKLWCSLWFVYGSLMFVLIFSFMYNPEA